MFSRCAGLPLVIFFCILFLVAMPKNPRPCPCFEHENALTPFSTWQRHAEQIARGARARWTGEEENLPPVQPVVEVEILSVEEQYALELTELVARGVINVTGAEAVCKITHRRYQDHLPDDITMPSSWYKAKNIAMDGRETRVFTRDFCPICDYLFPEEPRKVYCPTCKKRTRYINKRRKPARQAYYIDIAAKVKSFFTHPLSAKEVLHGTNRPHPEGHIDNREVCVYRYRNLHRNMYIYIYLYLSLGA